MTELVFRPMAVSDIPEVARIEVDTFSTPWRETTFQSLLERPGVEMWIAERLPGIVAAYAVLWCIQDEGELANIAVRQTFQRRGIGAELLDCVLGVAQERGVKSVYLEVRPSNEAAQTLYTSRDFQQVGVRRNYYDRPAEDAWIFMKQLA
ncbi:MAG: ribosomal protein S18-alanine N-acetyltransferase [Gemmatimonadota bacterium]|nr:MAG: ribosomal protein S18-alanine N-acetyltransferase [Gemmatimonadota bacterium]